MTFHSTTTAFAETAFSYLERLQGSFNRTNLKAVEDLQKSYAKPGSKAEMFSSAAMEAVQRMRFTSPMIFITASALAAQAQSCPDYA